MRESQTIFADIAEADRVAGNVSIRWVHCAASPDAVRIATELLAGVADTSKHPAVVCLAAALGRGLLALRLASQPGSAGPDSPDAPLGAEVPPVLPLAPVGGAGAIDLDADAAAIAGLSSVDFFLLGFCMAPIFQFWSLSTPHNKIEEVM